MFWRVFVFCSLVGAGPYRADLVQKVQSFFGNFCLYKIAPVISQGGEIIETATTKQKKRWFCACAPRGFACLDGGVSASAAEAVPQATSQAVQGQVQGAHLLEVPRKSQRQRGGLEVPNLSREVRRQGEGPQSKNREIIAQIKEFGLDRITFVCLCACLFV